MRFRTAWTTDVAEVMLPRAGAHAPVPHAPGLAKSSTTPGGEDRHAGGRAAGAQP